MASRAYSEQLGVKRQPASGPNKKAFAGDRSVRYRRRAKTKMCWATFIVWFSRSLQQCCFPQHCQKIRLDLGKAFPRDGWARHQHQVNRPRQIVLMEAEGFPQ